MSLGSNIFRMASGPGRKAPVTSGQPVVPATGAKPYSLAGGWANAQGKMPAVGVQPVVQPPSYQPGSMRLPSGYGIGSSPAASPAPAPAASVGNPGTYGLGQTPPSQRAMAVTRRGMAGSGIKPPPPAPTVGPSPRQAVNNYMMKTRGVTKGLAPQVAGLGSSPAPASAPPTVWQATHPSAPTPAPSAAPPSGQQAWSALMGPSGGASAAPVAPTAAPAAPAPRPSLGARLAGSAGRGVKNMVSTPLKAAGRWAPGAVITAMVDSASDNPSEGFMHLGQQGAASAGLGRVMSTLGHKMSGQSAPTDITGGQLYDSFMHHTPVGDTLTGAYNWAAHPQQSFTNLGMKLNSAVDSAGQWLSGKGDSMIADASPGSASQGEDAVVPGGRTMTADQLNSQYEKLGVGGEHPASAPSSSPFVDPVMDRLRSRGSETAPKSGDTPAVTGSGQSQAAPINPDLGRVGYADTALDHAAMEAALSGDYQSAASLGQALANMRGQAGGIQAHMLGSKAQMAGVHADAERANNPLGGYMNPVGLHILDQQYGGTGNIVGAGQASGIGLGPSGAISPTGMKQYASMKHPAFANLIGNKDAAVDQWRDAYNGIRSKFAAGDQQLQELNTFLSQALRLQYSPEELDAAAQPGWFGSGASGASQNQQFYRHTGVR